MRAKVLSITDREGIKANTTLERNEKMYRLVISRIKTHRQRVAVKEAISKGLRESSQYCPFTEKQSPASASQHEVLNELRPRLVEDMEVDPVLDRLIETKTIDHHIREVIDAEKTKREKVDTLLVFISRTHSQSHDTFMDILRSTNSWLFE